MLHEAKLKRKGENQVGEDGVEGERKGGGRRQLDKKDIIVSGAERKGKKSAINPQINRRSDQISH